MQQQNQKSLVLIGLAMLAAVGMSFLFLIKSCNAITPDIEAMTKNMDTVDRVQFHKNLASSYKQMMLQAINDGSGSKVTKYKHLMDEQQSIADSLEWDRIVRISDTVAKEHGSKPIQLKAGATDRIEPIEFKAGHTPPAEMVFAIENGPDGRDLQIYPSRQKVVAIPPGHYNSISIDSLFKGSVVANDGPVTVGPNHKKWKP
jgi:hypothetical protein